MNTAAHQLINHVVRKQPRLPSAFHAAAVASGRLQADASQGRILPKLDHIVEELGGYDEAMGSHAAVLSALEEARAAGVAADEARQQRGTFLFTLNRLAKGVSTEANARILPNSYFGLPEPPAAPVPPRGVYLHGDVGCGKSLMMDMLFHCASPCVQSSARVHYHSFMASVYALIHRYDAMTDAQRAQLGVAHPLDAVVGQLGRANAAASGGGLLCFDEFQVADVADARLMHGIFHRLMHSGTIVCFTANRAPADVNRSQLRDQDFIPFLDLIHDRCELVHVDSGIDYRERKLREENQSRELSSGEKQESNRSSQSQSSSSSSSSSPQSSSSSSIALSADDRERHTNYLGPHDEGRLHDAWERVTDGLHWDNVHPVCLSVAHGRSLTVDRAVADGRAVQMSVGDLIEAAIGANDYRALCKFSKHIFLTDVLPKFGNDTRNFARRFITFIDICYETKARLFMRMEAASLNDMFEQIDLSSFAAEMAEGLQFEGEVGKAGIGADNRNLQQQLQSSLYSGEDEKFAFKRAISRLKEMQTEDFGKPGLFDFDLEEDLAANFTQPRRNAQTQA